MVPALLVMLALVAIALATARSPQAADLRVYYYASRVLIRHQGEIYGPASGIGWPQYFRYPPLFVLVFLPFALLPYKAAAAVWAALKCVALYTVVRVLGRRLDFPRTGFWWLVPALLCGGFVVQEFGLGNAQLFAFALVAACLLEGGALWPAFLLAFAVSLKVWPLFFVPYLAARRQWRVAVLSLACLAGLTVLPAAYFGWSGNLHLLHQWIAQEWGTDSTGAAAWFPSQSLSGVLQRYLTNMDYSKWPDPNYPQLHLLNLEARLVPWIWLLLAGSAYLGLLWLARKTADLAPQYTRLRLDARVLALERRVLGAPVTSPENSAPLLLADALAFCALPLLEPVSHRIAFVVLLWPATVAGALLARRGLASKATRLLIWAAVAMEGAEPLFSSSKMQRLFQVLGVDFWAASFLTAGLVVAWIEWRRKRHTQNETSARVNYELTAP